MVSSRLQGVQGTRAEGGGLQSEEHIIVTFFPSNGNQGPALLTLPFRRKAGVMERGSFQREHTKLEEGGEALLRSYRSLYYPEWRMSMALL